MTKSKNNKVLKMIGLLGATGLSVATPIIATSCNTENNLQTGNNGLPPITEGKPVEPEDNKPSTPPTTDTNPGQKPETKPDKPGEDGVVPPEVNVKKPELKEIVDRNDSITGLSETLGATGIVSTFNVVAKEPTVKNIIMKQFLANAEKFTDSEIEEMSISFSKLENEFSWGSKSFKQWVNIEGFKDFTKWWHEWSQGSDASFSTGIELLKWKGTNDDHNLGEMILDKSKEELKDFLSTNLTKILKNSSTENITSAKLADAEVYNIQSDHMNAVYVPLEIVVNGATKRAALEIPHGNMVLKAKIKAHITGKHGSVSKDVDIKLRNKKL